eukprot:GHRQ01039167.1.p1 GENE.GHRQ01039167.1~~GHRQ01039167.1.p1  ORF type:complete len:145 (-),score=17.82 GHRQ01039167.1:59-493(-)
MLSLIVYGVLVHLLLLLLLLEVILLRLLLWIDRDLHNQPQQGVLCNTWLDGATSCSHGVCKGQQLEQVYHPRARRFVVFGKRLSLNTIVAHGQPADDCATLHWLPIKQQVAQVPAVCCFRQAPSNGGAGTQQRLVHSQRCSSIC